MKKLLFVLQLLVACSLASADASWPSEEQKSLVEKRRANFPVQSFVSSVDWYEPLMLVKGDPERSILQLEKNPKEYKKAASILEQFNNYAFIVWQGGQIRTEQYWPGFDQYSRYDTASMHKTVVAVLLGMAVEEGLVESIDDPVSKYLREYDDHPMGPLPLKSLLEMASGIRTPPMSDSPASPYWQSYLGNDLPAAISHWPVVTKPYEEFYYANANTQLLGFILERVYGQRYGEILSNKLWKIIGADDARLWLDREGGSARVYCCLQANARDWLRFGLLLLNKGRVGTEQIVPAAWIEKMTQSSPANAIYGWQLWRGSPHTPERIYGKGIPAMIPAKDPFVREDTFYLDGSGGQRVYVIPSEQMVIVRIGAAAPKWDDSALPNAVIEE